MLLLNLIVLIFCWCNARCWIHAARFCLADFVNYLKAVPMMTAGDYFWENAPKSTLTTAQDTCWSKLSWATFFRNHSVGNHGNHFFKDVSEAFRTSSNQWFFSIRSEACVIMWRRCPIWCSLTLPNQRRTIEDEVKCKDPQWWRWLEIHIMCTVASMAGSFSPEKPFPARSCLWRKYSQRHVEVQCWPCQTEWLDQLSTLLEMEWMFHVLVALC